MHQPLLNTYFKSFLSLIICLFIFSFITPAKTYAVCTVSATATCTRNTANCPGAEECPCNEGGTACRAISATSEQTCSAAYDGFSGCAVGSGKSLICGTTGAPPPTYSNPSVSCTTDSDCSNLGPGWTCISGRCGVINCYTQVPRDCGGGGASCTGLRSGEDTGCNYCVVPIVTCTPPCEPGYTCDQTICRLLTPVCTLSATPTSVRSGGSSTLTWTTNCRDIDTCTCTSILNL